MSVPDPGSRQVMLTVAGQPFRCECGGNVLTRTGTRYACNNCGAQYEAYLAGHLDLSLTGLAERVKRYGGHVEDEDERVLVLGLFAGAADRLRARVRELYRQGGHAEAQAQLRQVALALGEGEDWER